MAWVNEQNVPIADLPLDKLVGEYDSQDPQFKKLIVKSGLEPVAPAGSVEISRNVDNNTSVISVVYAILKTPENSGSINYDLAPESTQDQSIVTQSAIPAIVVSNPIVKDQAQVLQDIKPVDDHSDYIWIFLLIIVIASLIIIGAHKTGIIAIPWLTMLEMSILA